MISKAIGEEYDAEEQMKKSPAAPTTPFPNSSIDSA